jgi:hypothetical protein
MADGTLRLSVDIEPRDAQAAFRLFGAPGTAVALAALRAGNGKAGAQVEEPKGGAAAKWLGMRCAEPAFQAWIEKQFSAQWACATGNNRTDYAASTVREVLLIESRAEIDNTPGLKATFDALIRLPYAAHMSANN